MAFARVLTLLAFILLQTLSARSDFQSPLFPSLSGDVCKGVECGKGTCKPSSNSIIPFECDCDPGWKQSLSPNDDGLKFLPCLIPNCTLNSSCLKAHAPTRKSNESVFDVCNWIDCGDGSCNRTSLVSYSCKCDAGYHNILNLSALPCLKECAFGVDCTNLGIPLTNSSNTSPPTSDGNASLILRGSSLWLLMLFIFIANTQLQ